MDGVTAILIVHVAFKEPRGITYIFGIDSPGVSLMIVLVLDRRSAKEF